MHAERRIYTDADALARAVAQHVVTCANDTRSKQRPFTVALAGGSTPRPAYAYLARPDVAGRIAWDRVHVFWGDERCVPPDHPDSNYRMAREVLLDHVPIPDANVHRMRGELPPEEAAQVYEAELRECFGEIDVTGFDLVLLGLGADGHTASLFPGTEALKEQGRWVVANDVETLETTRLTLTLPAINAAEDVAFIVSGERKREILRRVLLAPDPDAPSLPAQRVQPREGRLIWMMDRAALGEGYSP
jgi:6-phosphogluconolactonase